MMPERFVDLLGEARASAILRCPTRQAAASAMEAAVRGGFRIVEFTLTIPGALDLVEEFSRRQDLIVGAGTVLTSEEARAAVTRGARFLVSPVIDREVIAAGLSLGDRKSTRLNSSHLVISYAVFCLKKKKKK